MLPSNNMEMEELPHENERQLIKKHSMNNTSPTAAETAILNINDETSKKPETTNNGEINNNQMNNNTDKKKQMSDFKPTNLDFMRRIWAITTIVWPSWYSLETLIIIIQFGLGWGYAWSYVAMSNNAGNLLTAINELNKDDFKYWLLYTGGAMLLGGFSSACIVSLGNYLCLTRFRYHLTIKLTETYMSRLTYFKLIHLDRSIDDPDTRMVYDIYSMCLKLKLILFGTPMYVGYIATTVALIYFFIKLLEETGWFVPVFTVITFVVSTILTRILAIKPAQISRKFNDIQSEYQFHHTYFAMHSEHIAFLNGSERESNKMLNIFENLNEANTLFSIWTMPLNFVSIVFYWGNQWLCYIIPGLAWLWTNNLEITDYTILTNVSFTLYGFLFTMTTYLLLFQEWSELIAVTSRVGEYMEVLNSVASNKRLDGNCKFIKNTNDEDDYDNNDDDKEIKCINVENVTLNRPGSSMKYYNNNDNNNDVNDDDDKDDVLLSNVTFKVDKNNCMVIMGPSGIGKSSLLRVIGGLWPAKEGTISKPFKYGRGGIMFIPQKPYLTFDSLEAQIYYPLSKNEIKNLDETVFVELLKEVELDYILNQFKDIKQVRNWSQVLSVGEQQRLGIARILFHLPSIVIMDESTSAMDEPVEEQVFIALKKRGIALLSVAHRSTVRKFHDYMFIIDRKGNWKIEPTKKLQNNDYNNNNNNDNNNIDDNNINDGLQEDNENDNNNTYM